MTAARSESSKDRIGGRASRPVSSAARRPRMRATIATEEAMSDTGLFRRLRRKRRRAGSTLTSYAPLALMLLLPGKVFAMDPINAQQAAAIAQAELAKEPHHDFVLLTDQTRE